MPRMFWVALIVGLAGAVFALQGIGVLGGGQMSGSPFWAVVGSIMVVAAVVVGWRARRTVPR